MYLFHWSISVSVPHTLFLILHVEIIQPQFLYGLRKDFIRVESLKMEYIYVIKAWGREEIVTATLWEKTCDQGPNAFKDFITDMDHINILLNL